MNEELKVIISAEISKMKQSIEQAKNSIKGFQEQVEKAKKKVDDNFKKMGESISNGIKTTVTSLAALGTALLALGASTAEYRAEQAKLQAAFETVGGTAEQAKETYNDLYRVLGDTGSAVEAAQQLANITQEESKLAEYTNICQGVYAKWGTAIDVPGFAEAINHTIELGSVQGTLADGLEWLGISTDDFNAKLEACTSTEQREKLVRETLNGLYAESAALYEETNAQVLAQNEATAAMQEKLAALGEAVAPVVTAFTQFASDALAAVVPYVQQLVEQYLPLLQDILSGVSNALSVAFDWVKKHETLLKAVGVVIAIVVTAIGAYNAVAAIKAAMAALEVTSVMGLVAAYTAQAAAMLIAIAPYVLIVAAIAAVIAIIVTCVKHWDKIKAKAVEVADKIKAKVEDMKNAVSNWFSNMTQAAKDKASEMLGAISDKFGQIKEKIKEKLDNAKQTVKDSIQKIKDLFSFDWQLPKPKFPSFSVTGGEAPWGFMGQGSLPKISVKWNALGGVFTKPTVMGYGGSLQGLAENGAEMIAPLENNLEWLDKLAGMLNDRMGGNQPTVLMVDGEVFARTAIKTINQQTRQTGRLALNLV